MFVADGLIRRVKVAYGYFVLCFVVFVFRFRFGAARRERAALYENELYPANDFRRFGGRMVRILGDSRSGVVETTSAGWAEFRVVGISCLACTFFHLFLI